MPSLSFPVRCYRMNSKRLSQKGLTTWIYTFLAEPWKSEEAAFILRLQTKEFWWTQASGNPARKILFPTSVPCRNRAALTPSSSATPTWTISGRFRLSARHSRMPQSIWLPWRQILPGFSCMTVWKSWITGRAKSRTTPNRMCCPCWDGSMWSAFRPLFPFWRISPWHFIRRDISQARPASTWSRKREACFTPAISPPSPNAPLRASTFPNCGLTWLLWRLPMAIGFMPTGRWKKNVW